MSLYPKRRTVTSILIIAFLLASVVTAWSPISVAYHRWRYRVANDYMWHGPKTHHPDGLVSIDITDVGPTHDYHLAQLVAMNAVARIDFTFSNITNDQFGSQLGSKLRPGNCPPSLHIESPAPNDSAAVHLTVWCEHDTVAAWKSFLAEVDAVAQKPQVNAHEASASSDVESDSATRSP